MANQFPITLIDRIWPSDSSRAMLREAKWYRAVFSTEPLKKITMFSNRIEVVISLRRRLVCARGARNPDSAGYASCRDVSSGRLVTKKEPVGQTDFACNVPKYLGGKFEESHIMMASLYRVFFFFFFSAGRFLWEHGGICRGKGWPFDISFWRLGFDRTIWKGFPELLWPGGMYLPALLVTSWRSQKWQWDRGFFGHVDTIRAVLSRKHTRLGTRGTGSYARAKKGLFYR